jgi:glycosyltransferase involved in cell wall biosynthesis
MGYNILHLVPLFEIGGLQRQIANWIEYDPNGNRHFLGLLNFSTEGFVLLKKEIPILFNDNAQRLEHLIVSLVENKVHVIVAHNRAAWDKGAMIRKKLPECRLFFVAHGRDLKFPREIEASFVDRIHCDSAFTEKIICTSKCVESMLRDLIPEARSKIVRVYNGVAAPPQRTGTNRGKDALQISSDCFLAGTVTRLAPDKNLEFLIQAADLLVKRGRTKFLFLILGNGRDEPSLRDGIKRLGVNDWVRLEPAQEAVGAHYEAFDLYVNCSPFESCSMSLLEAMSYGLPVLAPIVGGNPELLIDEQVGFLYPADDLGAFVEKFELLHCDSNLRSQLGIRAREHVIKNFALCRMIQEYQSIFDNRRE